jgi:hypothetical protein
MKQTYTIELTYNAKITEVVEANDEGEAYDKARTLAEEADIRDFSIIDEHDARIVETL